MRSDRDAKHSQQYATSANSKRLLYSVAPLTARGTTHGIHAHRLRSLVPIHL